MRQLLVFARDYRTADTLTGFLPPGWRVTGVQEAEDALLTLHDHEPDLMVLDGEPEGLSAGEFLRLAWERIGLLPPVLFLPRVPLDQVQTRALEGAGMTKVLAHPVHPPDLEQALAPYLVPPALPAMRLVELVASAMRDTEGRLISFLPGGAPMGLLLGGGYIETVVHPSFRDLWRARLEKAGHALPPPRTELLQDLLFLEADLPRNDPALLDLKREAIALVLQNVPADAVYRLQERRGLSRTPLLPVPLHGFLPLLAERVPEKDLAPLADPGVVVRRRGSMDVRNLQLTPQEGYLLYQCEQPMRSAQLVQAGPAAPAQTLRTLFLLLLLGALETVPDAGDPPQLAVLSGGLERDRRSVALQSAAILNLAESFQSRGVNPQQVLGVPNNASYEVVCDAHDTMQKRFAPEALHPEVRQRFAKDILFLRAKVSEAFLMLQGSYLERRKQEREVVVKESLETRSVGESKTVQQRVGDQHLREADRLFRYAQELQEQDQTYESLQYLKLALLHNPGLAPAHNLMGRILASGANARSKHMAEKEFLEAVRLDPWDIGNLLDLAELYIQVSLPARCRTYLEQAQKLNPKEPRVAELKAALRQLE